MLDEIQIIINVSGYINDWYDYKIGFSDKEVRSDISVFDGNNLNEIFMKNMNIVK